MMEKKVRKALSSMQSVLRTEAAKPSAVHMKQGDVCVQRGTVHGWRTTDGWARFYFVLLAAEPIQFEGKALGDEGFHLVKDK